MILYGGIDLHSNNLVLVISDETDRVLFEKRLSNDLSSVLSALSPYRDQLQGIAIESTFNWYWLVDGLEEAGLPSTSGQHSSVAAIQRLEIQR